MPAATEPTLALEQARARWGADVLLAGLFRPGPDPEARTALTRAVSRRGNRRRAQLPARVLVAVDGRGRALLCPYAPDPQGGHPEGDDLYAAPFEELGAVATGPLSLVALLDAGRPVVLESVWLDHDAATVTALLAGEPLPESLELGDEAPGGADDQEEDEGSPYAEALLAQADAAQARADALRALALAAQAEESPATGEPPAPPRPPPPPPTTDPGPPA